MPPFNRDFAPAVPAFPYMPPTPPLLLVRTVDAGRSAQKIDLHPPTFTSSFQARSHIARHHAATQPPSLRSLWDGGVLPFYKLSKYWRKSGELLSATLTNRRKAAPESADDAVRRHQREWNVQSQIFE